MPVIGNVISLLVINKLIEKANLIISFIFLILAIEIYKSKDNQETIFIKNIFMIVLIAFTVSIDSLLVGLALGLKQVNIYLVSIIFSITSGLITFIGITIGNKIKYKYHDYATHLGIIILLVLSFKYLIS